MLKKITQSILQQNVIILFLSLVLVFGIFKGDLFLNSVNIHNIARQISFDIPLALALTTVLIIGGIDLSIGSVLSMSAALTMGLQPYGTYFAVLVALLFGILIGTINGLLVTKGKVVPFITTLGTMTLVKGIMLTYTKQQSIAGIDESFTFWGDGSIGVIPTPIIVVLIVALILHMILKYTKFGRNLYAIGGNSESAYTAGINVEKNKIFAFMISGFLAALSGVLLASRLNSSTTQLGLDSTNWAIAAAIMGGASMAGGRGKVFGTIIGVASLGILINGMNLIGVFTYYQIGIRALILITVVAVDAVSASKIRENLQLQAYGKRE
ncbi:MAG: ABC transporter permease [Flexilinea sp.]